MDSFRGQGGIQMLLTAEQEAGRIVSAARNAKQARLKQAKDEAEKEVEQYRFRLEEEYQNQVSETNQSATAKKLEEETQAKIQNLKNSGSKVSKDVVNMLIHYVTTT
ncbi:PREDICTED: V-type proton ATPase subunit G3 [Tarenaya hassleriana]|uniref:V-type proton ATPase subunit G3 n=1 Tax=Tarenaya hassleriana TaxID=28532 RepID=UPI0008FD1CC5|nr:PREDICTED: V-type proton ATPase subunit G3 [Tarenaya hassleriana]